MARKKMALRAYRKRNGQSAAQTGKRLGVAGSTFRSWENGTREMPAEKAIEAEKAIGIDRVILRPDLFRRST